MTGATISHDRQFLSSMTLALFEDSGWYLPASTASILTQPLTMGTNLGCSFFNTSCNTDTPPDVLKFAGICPRFAPPKTYRCGHDRTYIAMCSHSPLMDVCQITEAVQTNDGDPARCTDPSIATPTLSFWQGQTFGPQSRCLEYDDTRSFTRRGIALSNLVSMLTIGMNCDHLFHSCRGVA